MTTSTPPEDRRPPGSQDPAVPGDATSETPAVPVDAEPTAEVAASQADPAVAGPGADPRESADGEPAVADHGRAPAEQASATTDEADDADDTAQDATVRPVEHAPAAAAAPDAPALPAPGADDGAPADAEPAASADVSAERTNARPETGAHALGAPTTTGPSTTGPSPTGPSTAAPSTTPAGSPGGWSKLGRAMRPKVNRSQLLAGLLCALLGFALAVQVSQTQEQQLSSLRQSDLVRLLDDVTQRANELESRVSGLQGTRDELSSGSGQQRAALELAQRQAESQGILSGRLPAEGPGIELTITETDERLPASKLFNILEELRNAGVEVVEVNGVRLVTSSYFEETSRGMVVDGQKISSPYRWLAIGDPSTLETALEIPGGAMASVRNDRADPKIQQKDLITISSTREPQAPQFATPVPVEGGN